MERKRSVRSVLEVLELVRQSIMHAI